MQTIQLQQYYIMHLRMDCLGISTFLGNSETIAVSSYSFSNLKSVFNILRTLMVSTITTMFGRVVTRVDKNNNNVSWIRLFAAEAHAKKS